MKPAYSNKQNIANGPIYTSLLVVFCMVLVTLYKPLMGWVWVLSACAIAIAYVRIKRNLPSVKNITLNLLAIFCMILLIYLSGDFGLMATMVNLLVVAACLKLINLHKRADYHLVLIVLFFLIACGFIYHQSIYLVAYYFSCLVVLFVTAFLLNRGLLSLGGSVKQSTKMMLQALPITLLLFIVVPRLPPFWQTNVQSNTQTGLSEQITPGDIANLAQSDQLVFRAEFDDIIPIPQQRYWRSIVLDQFDGKTWKITRKQNIVGQNSSLDEDYSIDNEGTLFRYLIIAQPNNTRWLYSLDSPVIEENMGNIPIYLNNQYQLFQADENSGSSLYILRSYPQATLRNFVPETDFARFLQVPLDSNQRTQAWVEKNIDPQMTFIEKLSILNGYFLSNPFSYTLKPPLMLSSPIDSFLFDNQKGFCSHYASALTYMLRLSDIPARMVAGYQGGEAQSNIITVRQYDAHAWVEAYDQENGWIRFDPTALVAPNRTMAGLLAALSAQESAIFNNEMSSFFDATLFDGIRGALTFIDHNWNQFVLEFNNDAQGSLIENIFGELNNKSLTTFLLVSLAGIGLFVAILFLPYKNWLRIERKTALQKLLIHMAKNGYIREKHEPLRQFYLRIRPQLSDELASKLSEFIDLYYEFRYQSKARINEKDLMELYLEVAAKKSLAND